MHFRLFVFVTDFQLSCPLVTEWVLQWYQLYGMCWDLFGGLVCCYIFQCLLFSISINFSSASFGLDLVFFFCLLEQKGLFFLVLCLIYLKLCSHLSVKLQIYLLNCVLLWLHYHYHILKYYVLWFGRKSKKKSDT